MNFKWNYKWYIKTPFNVNQNCSACPARNFVYQMPEAKRPLFLEKWHLAGKLVWIAAVNVSCQNWQNWGFFQNSTETQERSTFLKSVWLRPYTAISRKVVGKSARDSPERYCGWFWVHRSSNKFERMVREATEVCLRMLKESNNSEKIWHGYSVRNSVLIISHTTFRDCCVHIFSDHLSRNSCISSLIYGRSFCWQNYENISVET